MFYFFCKYGYADQTFEEQMQMLDYAKNTEMKKISIENEYDFNKNLDIKIEAKECEAECNSHKFLTDTNYFKIIGVVTTPNKKYEKLMGYCRKGYIQNGLPQGLKYKGKPIVKPVSLSCLSDNSYATIVYNIEFSSFARYKVSKDINFVVQRPAVPLPILLDTIKIDEDIRTINNLEI
jgi:hypothetical protein